MLSQLNTEVFDCFQHHISLELDGIALVQTTPPIAVIFQSVLPSDSNTFCSQENCALMEQGSHLMLYTVH